MRVAEAETYGLRGWSEKPFPAAQACRVALAAAAGVDAAGIAGQGGDIAARVRAARLEAIAAARASWRQAAS